MCIVYELRFSVCLHIQLYIPTDICSAGFTLYPLPGTCGNDLLTIIAVINASPLRYCDECIRSMTHEITAYYERQVARTGRGLWMQRRRDKLTLLLGAEMLELHEEIGGFERWAAAHRGDPENRDEQSQDGEGNGDSHAETERQHETELEADEPRRNQNVMGEVDMNNYEDLESDTEVAS